MKRLLIFLLLLALPAAAQKPAPAPLAEAPHYTLELENEKARVYRLELPAGESTAVHLHEKDFILVALSASDLESRIGDAAPEPWRMGPGEMQIAGGGFPHLLGNRGSEPFRALLIELAERIDPKLVVCGLAGQRDCGAELGGMTDDRYSITTLLETHFFRADVIEADRGTEMATHSHLGPHLAIAISDLELRAESAGREPQLIQQAAGTFAWIPGGGTHKLTNVGEKPAKWVAIEFKP